MKEISEHCHDGAGSGGSSDLLQRNNNNYIKRRKDSSDAGSYSSDSHFPMTKPCPILCDFFTCCSFLCIFFPHNGINAYLTLFFHFIQSLFIDSRKKKEEKAEHIE